MKNKKEKVYWKRSQVYHVPGPNKYSFERVLNIVGLILGLTLLGFVLFSMSQLIS